VGPVGLEQLEHPLVGGSGFAGEGEGDEVGEVVVADGDGVGVARMPSSPIVHAPMPGIRPGCAVPASSWRAWVATRRTVSARRFSTPAWWKCQ
jgi:hypothetical protein